MLSGFWVRTEFSCPSQYRYTASVLLQGAALTASHGAVCALQHERCSCRTARDSYSAVGLSATGHDRPPLLTQEGSTSLGFQALKPKLVGFVLCLGFQALNPKLMGFVWGHAAHACWRICCFLRVEGECERVQCKPQPMCTRFPFPHNSDKHAKACKS